MSQIFDFGIPGWGAFEAILSIMEIIECFFEFMLLIEDKGTVMGDGLVQWLTCEHQELRPISKGFDFNRFISIANVELGAVAFV